MTRPNESQRTTTSLVLLIAAEASADPRTVRKFLAGDSVKRTVSERIAAAASARGVSPKTT